MWGPDRIAVVKIEIGTGVNRYVEIAMGDCNGDGLDPIFGILELENVVIVESTRQNRLE